MASRVLVTAGASGIGLEIARAFAEKGSSVYTCDINEEALDSARSEIKGLQTRQCDVGDRAAVEAMVKDAAERLDGIDVLVVPPGPATSQGSGK